MTSIQKTLWSLKLCGAVSALGLMAAATAAAPSKQDQIFETNVTHDLNIASGEPEIAVDPTNPKRLVVVEFAVGSAAAPAAAYSVLSGSDPEKSIAASENDGRVMISEDLGEHWKQYGPPPSANPDLPHQGGGGDPMIAVGPDGTVYTGSEPAPDLHTEAAAKRDYSQYTFMLAASTDHGRTFGKAMLVGTPLDRPWLTVDQSTGKVYTVSSGNYNPLTQVRNTPGPDAPNDRWLVEWQPHLASKSEPRRIGGPDFSGSGGNTISAAHGVIAATFVLGGPPPGGGFAGNPPPPQPVPESLKSIMKDGVTSCSLAAPCLFFETSTDGGAHWTRHHVPVAGGMSGVRAQVSADPSTPGRYAIAVLNPARTGFQILVTNDSGATWSGPVAVPEGVQGVNFKQWMAYGPTGVLGLMWRKYRDDLAPPPSDARLSGGGLPNMSMREKGFDVYTSVSCDGGTTWYAPVRVNTESSPEGVTPLDDLSYIALDAKYAHLVWGDRRLQPSVKTTVPNSMAGRQVYYGRVPFSVVTRGAACGRREKP
jgi:hypothetical protein